MIKIIFLFILSTVWVVYNNVPSFPIGFVIALFFIASLNFKKYLVFIFAMILGFVGTGVALQFYKELTVNPLNGQEHHFSKFLLGFNVGTKNLTYLLKDEVTLYKTNLHHNERKVFENYLREFTYQYNENNVTLLTKSFLYQNGSTEDKVITLFNDIHKNGKVEDMYYLGNVIKAFPNINPSYFSFVYHVKFIGQESWRLMQFDVVFVKGDIKIMTIDLYDIETTYLLKHYHVNYTIEEKE